MSKGIVYWPASPRFSNGYGDARHLPSVLVENHSLKPYDQRVLGTYVLLESMLTLLGRESASLRAAVAKDHAARSEQIVLSFGPKEETPPTIELLGIRSEMIASPITGAEVVRFSGEPVTLEVPYVDLTAPAATVTRPKAYWIPPAWTSLVEQLSLHGIEWQRVQHDTAIHAEVYRLEDVSVGRQPFEGRVTVTAKTAAERGEQTMPAGSVRVSMDQPRGTLAALLLEPEATDSLFAWGFFLAILQRTEYAEAYAMEPLGRAMLDRDPALRKEFEAKLEEDEQFAGSPRARLDWLYRRSPYYDERHLLYPIVREVAAQE
jgi:hypothetical protein